MSVKSFTIGNVTYNAAMASAVGQDELLSLLTQPIMERLITVTQLGGDAVDEAVLMPMFMAMNTGVKNRVASLLLNQVRVSGGNVPVDIKDFSGRMVEYNTFLAQLLLWNLTDFFVWLASVRKESDVTPTTPSQAQ